MAVLPFGNSSVGQEDFVGHDCKSNFDFVGIRLGQNKSSRKCIVYIHHEY
jgi:hypothetical protein